MVQRSLVTLLAALGGILVILGGILGFLLSLGPRGYGPMYYGTAYAAVFGALAVIMGAIILVYSGFTHLRGAERNLTGGVVLIVLGIVTWMVVGNWILVAVGSFLTVVAGLVLLAQVLVDSPRVRGTEPV
jgi:multisubunit Na+/H+ antiporter MnhG subunit